MLLRCFTRKRVKLKRLVFSNVSMFNPKIQHVQRSVNIVQLERPIRLNVMNSTMFNRRNPGILSLEGHHPCEYCPSRIPSPGNIIPQGVRPSGVSFTGDITPRTFMNFLVFCYIKTQTRFIPSKILNHDQCHRTTFIVVFFNVNFQSCSRGYTRRRRPFGQCVRCQCHVHAAECDEYTGVCKVTLIIYNKQTGL